VLALALFWCRSAKQRRLCLRIFYGVGALLVAWCSFWGWFFRDGLGPGMVVSTGWLAWQRFAEEMIPGLVFLAVVASIGYFGVRVSGKRCIETHS
jgi:hypothetical protein